MTSIHEILRKSPGELKQASDTPRVDVEVLLAFVLKKTRTFLFSHPEYLLSPAEQNHFQDLLTERKKGMPIAYLIQQQAFWSLPFKVSPHTLIPRPETELLVERALYHIQDIPHAQVLDLGTGCGEIACAILHERPDCFVTAVDISEEALAIARFNAKALHLDHLYFCQSHWFDALPHGKPFHLIVSNPPYLAEHDPHLKQGDLRFEPQSALCSGEHGLDALTHLIQTARSYLLPHGWLCLEHGYQQKKALRALLEKHHYQMITTHQDYQGHDRVTEASAQEFSIKEAG